MRIVSAAIKTEDGEVFSGERHAELIRMAIISGSEDYVEGFLTEDGAFVTREEAAKIAFEAGQIKNWLPKLSSYDIY